MEVSTTSTEDANGTTICENEMQVSIPSLNKRLVLTLLQSEWEMEPIFSGAAWAGSVLWAASQVLVENVLFNRQMDGISVLELGCGLGIPGMVCSHLGAKEVLLTEQPQLIPLIIKNVDRNFSLIDNDIKRENIIQEGAEEPAISVNKDCIPEVTELSWGQEETEKFVEMRNNKIFDMILVCDCVFEPLYGDSWKLLAQTLGVLVQSEETEVLIACERRDEDAIDEFLTLLSKNFIITTVWTNFKDDELKGLLENSHVGGEKKPLRVLAARRRMDF